jgi:hypothetical protein
LYALLEDNVVRTDSEIMSSTNLYVGWLCVLLGLSAGTVIGLFFSNQDWLGGYGSWRRRMLRLGHVALVGTGLLNILFSLSAEAMQLRPPPSIAAVLFLVGAATMPTICFLSAWRVGFRHLFFVPVVSLLGATGELLIRGWIQ